MALFKTLTITTAILLVVSLTAFAGEEKQEAKQETKQEVKQDAKPEVKAEAKKEAPKELKNQTNCPVMGGEIDSTDYTDIQGQRVYHCCPMCSAKLKKDPDTYFKKAGEAGVLFENIQTTCPVSGEEIEDKSVYSDFEGRRIAFCCKKCRGSFNNDPQKYLSKIDAPVETDAETEEKDLSGHEGHNH